MASPRTPGRPPIIPERGSSVSTWISELHHDQLVKLARQREQSVSALLRALVTDRLRTFPTK